MPKKSMNEEQAASYHHGDLHQGLIFAAREALQSTPPEQIMLKVLAAQLGVTQAALYRHFDGRDGLMLAVAADGFQRLESVLEEERTKANRNNALERICRAYIEFGLGNVGVYRLMFSRQSLGPAKNEKLLARAADASFQILADCIPKSSDPKRATTIAISAWATLHGIVMLKAEGLLFGPSGRRLTISDLIAMLVSSAE